MPKAARRHAPTVTAWKEEIRAREFDRVRKMGTQYVKVKRLGAGAFGEGWLCDDAVNRRQAVVKICHAALVNDQEEFAAKKEVALMEAMDHPNVVKFYEAWVEDGDAGQRLHIAMEYCDAGDLGALLKAKYAEARNQEILAAVAQQVRVHSEPLLRNHRPEDLVDDPELCVRVHREYNAIAEQCFKDVVAKEGPLDSWSLATVESWAVQLLWGLWYIHKKRVVHRDIKPDNIFLSGGGAIIKIGDFGISGLQAHTNGTVRTKAGTPICMAPEMWDAHDLGDEYDGYNDRVDVFSVGCLLYEVAGLTRPFDARLPFAGRFCNEWSPQRLLFLKNQICLPGVKPLHLPPAQIEASFFEVVRTMLRKNPKVRPTSGQVLRSIRMQRVARRVIEVFQRAGAPDALDPLLMNTDAHHDNAHNPVNHHLTLHHTAKFMASTPDAEVLMMVKKFNLTLRRGPGRKEPPLGYITMGDIVEVAARADKDGLEWIKTQSGWCMTAFNGAALFSPCEEKYVCRDSAAAVSLGAYEPVLNNVTGMIAGALKDKLKTVRSKSPIGPARVLSRPPSPPSPVLFAADGRAVSPLQFTPVRSPQGAKNGHKVKNELGPPLSAAAPPGSAPRSRSPAAPANWNQPARVPVARHASPLQRPGTPTGGERHARRRSPSPGMREGTPVRSPPRRSATKQSGATRGERATKTGKEDKNKEELRRYRHLLLGVLGKDRARSLLTEYFDHYRECKNANLLNADGTCAELEAFEKKLLQSRLGNDTKVLQWIRAVARLYHPSM